MLDIQLCEAYIAYFSTAERYTDMEIAVAVGEMVGIGYGATIVGLVAWSVGKMIHGLAHGLLKS